MTSDEVRPLTVREFIEVRCVGCYYNHEQPKDSTDAIISLLRERLTSDEAVEAAVARTFSAEWAEGEDISVLRQGRIAEYRVGITAAIDAVLDEESRARETASGSS